MVVQDRLLGAGCSFNKRVRNHGSVLTLFGAGFLPEVWAVKQDPNDPRTYPDAGLRAAWLLAALFVVMFIVAVIGLLSH
jgi:hypothetical protein